MNKYKFPPIKIRILHGNGRPKIQHVQVRNVLLNAAPDADAFLNVPALIDELILPPIENELIERNLYEERKRRELFAWRENRSLLEAIGLEMNAPPSPCYCKLCHVECIASGIYRCRDCGPEIYLCSFCLQQVHLLQRLHVSEQYLEGMFVSTHMEKRWKLNYHTPECRKPDVTGRTIKVIDMQGRLQKVIIEFCECQPDVAIMVRHGLWPASPTRPEHAFTFEFMETVRTLQVHTGISLLNLSEAIQMNAAANWPKMEKDFYELLVGECIEEYRNYRYRIDFLRDVVPDSSDGTVCPACPKSDGTVILSLDAVFGLSRKMNAGKSQEAPKHGTRLFCHQEDVDKFVKEYNNDSVSLDDGCNNFEAGSSFCSGSKTAGFDETAVFGAACKHEFPLKFLNLKKGESLANAVYLINMLRESMEISSYYPDEEPSQTKKRVDLFVMYDIACKLKPHLEKNNSALLEVIKLAIPVFHAYGHKVSCQKLMSPQTSPGFGMADGEQLERLWSFAKRFVKVTKEMTPSHRIDFLTDVFIYHGKDIEEVVGSSILMKLVRAKKQEADAKEELDCLLLAFQTGSTASPISYDEVEKWSREQKLAQEQNDMNGIAKKKAWDIEYVEMLSLLHSSRTQLEQCTEDDIVRATSLASKCERLEKRIATVEKKKKIFQRWTRTSLKYKMINAKIMHTQLLFNLEKIHHAVRDRWYLKEAMNRYADGQAIFKNLSKQMKKVTASVQRFVKVYNNIAASNKDAIEDLPANLVMKDVFREDSATWELLGGTGKETHNTLEAIRLLHLVHRAQEEQDLIRTDVQCMVDHYQHELRKADKANENLNHVIRLEAGKKAVIQRFKLSLTSKLQVLTGLFSDKLTGITWPQLSE